MPKSYYLVSHSSEPHILVIRNNCVDGWSLPTMEHRDGWFVNGYCSIARKVSQRLGLHVTALRQLEEGEVEVCELENHSPAWSLPAECRWVHQDEINQIHMASPGLETLLWRWFQERELGEIPAARPPWERSGWYSEAVAWIQAAVANLGYSQVGPIEQFKAAWLWSCIFRVPTNMGILYFKAVSAKPPSEPSIIEALATRWARNVPRILAVDHDRGWMLTEDFGDAGSLDDKPVARWQSAARQFARIQIDCSRRMDIWRNLACPDRTPQRLKEHMDTLLHDPDILLVDQPYGFTPEQLQRLHSHLPRLRDMWDQLATFNIPDSIVHQDFRDGNLRIHKNTYLYYDWSDTVIGHPFFSVSRMLDFIWPHPANSSGKPSRKLSDITRRRRIRDAYLEPWAIYEPMDRLQEAFRLVRQLNSLSVAIKWYLEQPYCEQKSSWGRMMQNAPTWAWDLKGLLKAMDDLEHTGKWVMDIEEEG